MITLCDVIDNCTECPRYGDDCDGDKMTEHTDLISRADAINAFWEDSDIRTAEVRATLRALPSAEAVSREEYEEVKAYMDTLVDAFIEDGEELAELVKVVRCKDCRWQEECSQFVVLHKFCGVYQEISFCSHGERKQDD